MDGVNYARSSLEKADTEVPGRSLPLLRRAEPAGTPDRRRRDFSLPRRFWAFRIGGRQLRCSGRLSEFGSRTRMSSRGRPRNGGARRLWRGNDGFTPGPPNDTALHRRAHERAKRGRRPTAATASWTGLQSFIASSCGLVPRPEPPRCRGGQAKENKRGEAESMGPSQVPLPPIDRRHTACPGMIGPKIQRVEAGCEERCGR
jgi:hypothetical protein